MLLLFIFALSHLGCDGEITHKIVRGSKRKISRKTWMSIEYTGDTDFDTIEKIDGVNVFQPIPVPEKFIDPYKWHHHPDHHQKAILNNVVQWSEISQTGSGKIGLPAKLEVDH